MGEQIGSALVSEVVNRAASIITGKRNDHKSIDGKVYRLEMLIIKIKSAVQISSEFDINIEPLQEWQEMLKKAVSEATEVLCKFKDRTVHEKANQTVEGESSSHDPPTQVDNEADKTLCKNKVGAHYEKENHAVEGVSSSDDQSIHEEGQYTTLHVDKQAAKVFGKLNCSYPHEKTDRTIVEGGSSSYDPSTKGREKDGEPRLEIMRPANSGSNKKRFFECTRVLDPRTISLRNPLTMLNRYIENGEKVNMLMKTVEKLEKVGADIGDFIELLKLQQSPRPMSMKRPRLEDPVICLPLSKNSAEFKCNVKSLASILSLDKYDTFPVGKLAASAPNDAEENSHLGAGAGAAWFRDALSLDDHEPSTSAVNGGADIGNFIEFLKPLQAPEKRRIKVNEKKCRQPNVRLMLSLDKNDTSPVGKLAANAPNDEEENSHLGAGAGAAWSPDALSPDNHEPSTSAVNGGADIGNFIEFLKPQQSPRPMSLKRPRFEDYGPKCSAPNVGIMLSLDKYDTSPVGKLAANALNDEEENSHLGAGAGAGAVAGAAWSPDALSLDDHEPSTSAVNGGADIGNFIEFLKPQQSPRPMSLKRPRFEDYGPKCSAPNVGIILSLDKDDTSPVGKLAASAPNDEEENSHLGAGAAWSLDAVTGGAACSRDAGFDFYYDSVDPSVSLVEDLLQDVLTQIMSSELFTQFMT